MMARSLALGLLAACSASAPPPEHTNRFYAWDSRRVLCSAAMDDLNGNQLDWARVRTMFETARELRWVVLLHAHAPGRTVSREVIDRLLTLAHDYRLDTLTFDELVPDHQPRGGVALAFDDDSVDEWFSIRDLLFAHHARVTFFVTRWAYMTPDQHDKLAQLRRDGHALEPHGSEHLHAVDYTHEHGVEAYVADEVMPSLVAMSAAGYHPTTFAYPFGEHDRTIDTAVLQHVERVRATLSDCPAGY